MFGSLWFKTQRKRKKLNLTSEESTLLNESVFLVRTLKGSCCFFLVKTVNLCSRNGSVHGPGEKSASHSVLSVSLPSAALLRHQR